MADTLNKRQVALARLALREVQNIQGSCGIFTQYCNEISPVGDLAKVLAALSAMEDKAFKLQAKLEKINAPYDAIEVEEIF